MQEGAPDKNSREERQDNDVDLTAIPQPAQTPSNKSTSDEKESTGKQPHQKIKKVKASKATFAKAIIGTKQNPQPRLRHSEEHRILLSLLIKARKASGISQKKLSALLGKAETHVAFLEGRDRELNFVEVARICAIVGLPLEELAKAYTERTNEV